LWITTPFSAFKAVTEPSVTLDEASLRKAVDALRLMDEANMTTPSDAQIVFKDSAYVIDAEDPGTTIDTTKIYVAVSQAIRTLEPQLDLDAAGCYVGPDVLATNDELAQTLERYNTYVPFQITYTFGEETEVLGAEVALQWYGIADDGTYWFNEGALGAWVASFAQRHDTVGTTRSFKTATGEDATVEGGTYGWEVDQEAEYAAIIDALNNHRGETRDPCYLETATDHGLDLDWGKSYIEVNLTTQYLYFVREGQIALESDVVTGAPWGGRATPEGVYDILWMESPSILRGDYIAPGQREYETQVSFWMQITYSGVGMHDATWQSRFGGDWYLNNGSHGCINMPWDKAQELYEIAWDGLPVIIHY
jgi:ribonuclease HI